MNGKYSCIAKFSNTCLEYGASYSYSEQVFENFSMQLYFPFIGNLSKSQQYISTTETSKHVLILVCTLYSYSEQAFENFSMQLYFPFISNLSSTETSKYSLILVLQLTLMTFMNIYNGFYAVNGQRF